jgi:hypothetical protein
MTATLWQERIRPTSVGEVAPQGVQSEETGAERAPGLVYQTKELEDVIKKLTEETASEGAEPRNWSVTLRLLLGWLTGLTFEEASILVGIKPDPLTRMLHGQLRVQPSTHQRIDRMLRITLSMRGLLDERDLASWFRGPVPALKNDTPIEAIRKRKIAQVEEVVASYFDTAYA